MKNVAAFYTTKSAKPGFAKNKDLVALGEKIYRGGIPEKQVPACAGCHSPDGAGIPAQFPRLGGQHADYVAAQMASFRAGARANGPMMLTIASKMSDQEIKAVSDYVAGLR
jgi:cytochrome c553